MKKVLLPALCLLLAATTAFAGAYTPGSYTETVDGHNGTITLTVTTSDSAIVDIKLGEHVETQGLGDKAMEALIPAMISANSADVDSITGATVTSDAVKAAVAAALVRAEQGDMDAAQEDAAAAATAVTFAEQCAAAGVDFTYEDPNASVWDYASTDATIDVATHASGAAKYVDETEGGCIKTVADLAARSATKYKVYYWIADENGAATIADAAKLENAQYVSYPFPNDGGKYAVKLQSNSIGTNTVITVDADGQPCAAIFGLSYKMDDAGDVYTSSAIMAETATYRNIMAGSSVMISYYEYNFTSEKKIGVGTRNAGARVSVEMDEELSTLTMNNTDENGKAIKMTVAAYKALSEQEQAAYSVRYLTFKAKVVALYSIG